MTLADNVTNATTPHRLFVSVNNTIYKTDANIARVSVWLVGSSTPTRVISSNSSAFYGIFATANGDIYVDNSPSYGRVDRWAINANISTVELYTNAACLNLFIDRNGFLYCTSDIPAQIIKKLLGSSPNVSKIVAGNGSVGSTSDMLSAPRGVAVSDNLSLYVADSGNNRIQMFQPGQLNGITVAGSGALGTIPLNAPVGVVLDADGYLFIADRDNNRIVGSGPDGFRCIVGCTNSTGNAADQLAGPRSLSFDSYGNLYVADSWNGRVQKFPLVSDSCGEFFGTTLNSISTYLFTLGTAPTTDTVETTSVRIAETTSKIVRTTADPTTSALNQSLRTH